MASTLPPLLLVLLALNPGGGPILTLAKSCNDSDFVLKDGETKTIEDINEERNSARSILYVKPEPGFEGVHVKVKGSDGKLYDNWFPAEPDCINYDQWHKMKLWAKINSSTDTLRLRDQIGTCHRWCKKNYSPQTFHNFSVVAYGPSQWLLEEPSPSCNTTYLETEKERTNRPSCRTPPTITTPLPLFVVIPVVFLVVFLVAAAVVAMLICRRRQQLATSALGEPASPSQPAEPASELHTIENELYEPYDKYAATGNTSPRHQESLHVMDNDLYQPFRGYHQETTPAGYVHW